MFFKGTSVTVNDSRDGFIELTLNNGSKERYSYTYPQMVVGNLMIGERYIEAQGTGVITNLATGITCDYEFHPRGWLSDFYTNRVEFMVKDEDGIEMIKLAGNHTASIEAEDLATGHTWTVFTAPPKPANKKVNFNMNPVALQMNQTSPALLAKLPPTDCR